MTYESCPVQRGAWGGHKVLTSLSAYSRSPALAQGVWAQEGPPNQAAAHQLGLPPSLRMGPTSPTQSPAPGPNPGEKSLK